MIPVVLTLLSISAAQAGCLFVPKFTSILTANTGFFYFNAVVQIPCYIMGMNLYISGLEKDNGATICECLLFLLISILLFFSQIKFSNIIMVWSMGTFSVELIKILAKKHIRNFTLEKLGRRSFYMFLTHLFFVRTLPLTYYKIFGYKVSGNILL